MAAARPYVLLNHIDAIISFFGLNLRLMMWIIALAVSSVRWKGTKIIISKKKEAKDKIVDIWIWMKWDGGYHGMVKTQTTWWAKPENFWRHIVTRRYGLCCRFHVHLLVLPLLHSITNYPSYWRRSGGHPKKVEALHLQRSNRKTLSWVCIKFVLQRPNLNLTLTLILACFDK